MSYFVMPYRVLFHDTMAYGSHHFLTNFKFQCEAREHLFFQHVVEASEQGRRDHETLVMLTQQGYARNLTAVGVGQKVAILVSWEDHSLSTFRLCFRVIGADGVPVSCGFQTVVCLSRETGNIVPTPPSILQGSELIPERLTSPSFAERVLAGKLQEVFDGKTCALGAAIAKGGPEEAFPRILDAAGICALTSAASTAELGRGVVFMFPGQGSYSAPLLRWLQRSDERAAALLRRADEIARHRLGESLLTLVLAEGQAEHDQIAARCPDLVQVGMYLAAVLSAQALQRLGFEPDALVGHSAGELAALAVGGAYSLEDGIGLLCHRLAALRALGGGVGAMVALCGARRRVESLLAALELPSVELAVINHEEQAVVAGTNEDVERLVGAAAAVGIESRRLPSPYPFHSQLLKPAVAGFESALRGLALRAPGVPVYSPIEGAFYSERDDLPRLLASHFVRHFEFEPAVRELHARGARVFIECGSNKTLGQFVRRLLRGESGIEVHSPFAPEKEQGSGLTELWRRGRELGLCPAPPAEPPAAKTVQPAQDRAVDAGFEDQAPIAIVSVGSVLPGASSSDQFWRNVLEGRGAICDAGELKPELAADFKSDGGVVRDKTYTLLGGLVRDFEPDLETLPYEADEFARLSRAQQLLGAALGECAAGLGGQRADPARTRVMLGATADGIAEYDEALLSAGLDRAAAELEADPEARDVFRRLLATAVGRAPESLERFAPYPSYLDVIERLLGKGTRVITVDAACASSLYAIVLGVEALRAGECDLALTGGVFASGPANGCLFAQFQGLSATGSRPFDASADGVVFSEGAAFVALKRLPDALAAGDRVLALIRGYGLASDGKSPSAAAPRREGQILALRRAYQGSGIDPATVQYVEAHATATPVGDAVEFSALKEVFGGRDRGLSPIELGSVKALIGHAGWAAGAASVIKMTKALEAGVMPPQSNYRHPSAHIDLASSPFAISTAPKPWPPNLGSVPRRCAVSGFGFGGTNAHLILEAFESGASPGSRPSASRPRPSPSGPLAVVGLASLFPFDRDRPEAAGERSLRFAASDLALPPGIMILPDVAEDMDASQALAVRAAALALADLGDAWKPLRERMGVVFGFEGKTGRAIEVNQRIYLDSLRRRLAEMSSGASLDGETLRSLLSALGTRIGRIRPSGPYTLSGFMPNVAAGRVASVFDLHGPSIVVGAGERSLYEALRLAGTLLHREKCDWVLAGALSSYAGCEAEQATASRRGNGRKRSLAEGVLALALARPETARARGFRILAELELLPEDRAEAPGSARVAGTTGLPYLCGAEGAIELARALDEARRTQGSTIVGWSGGAGRPITAVRVVGGREARRGERSASDEDGASPAPPWPQSWKGILGPEAPIYVNTPRLLPVPAGETRKPFTLGSARLLVLTDAAGFRGERTDGALAGLRHTLLCPASSPVRGARSVDLSSDRAAAESMREVVPADYDAIVAIKDLAGAPGLGSLAPGSSEHGGLLDLAFVCARHFYGRLQSGEAVLGTLCLNALTNDHPHPYTGLFGGFTKSLARELPESVLRAVVTDASDLGAALPQLEAEWRQGATPAAAEVVYRGGIRHEIRLVRLDHIAAGGDPWLNSGSVVLASGGGRGVTAVLMEEVLRRFHCRVLLLGRTDPSRVPAEVLEMDDGSFERYEPEFYRQQLARRRGTRPAELKNEYQGYRNAREVRATLERLGKIPGVVEYLPVDVTQAEAVEAAVARAVESHGRLDLVVHGAGLQSSRILSAKRLEDFQRIVATKVGGLLNLHEACRRHAPAARFHLLTSAFSVLGNDGQSDYGAANEAMNRVAEEMAAAAGGSWTTLAWLGWAGVGMTRGSEYAPLASARGLKAVTREEGCALFGQLLSGRPSAAVNVLLSDGEIAFFGVPRGHATASPEALEPSPRAAAAVASTNSRSLHGNRPDRLEQVWELSLATHAYLADHCVNGRPTLPATFELELAAQAARALRPECHVLMMEDARFAHFVKLLPPAGVRLRADARVVEERGGQTLASVRLVSDFVHRSGQVLEKDILHFEALVMLGVRDGESHCSDIGANGFRGLAALDPYLSPTAPVRLGGLFRCLSAIKLGEKMRQARFRLAATEKLPLIAQFLTPAVLLDGLFRVSIIHLEPSGAMPLYVPIHGGRFRFVSELNDARLHALGEELLIVASIPEVRGESIHNDWAQVVDSRGRVLLAAENLEGRRVGEVPHGR